MHRIEFDEFIKTNPTIGFTFETFIYKQLNLVIYDIGRQDKIRVLWKHYYSNVDAIIFVVYSSDRDRIEDSKEVLEGILIEEDKKDCPILVMANKQDLENALTTKEILEKLYMDHFKYRTYLVQGTSALTGQGIKEGLNWLINILKKIKK